MIFCKTERFFLFNRTTATAKTSMPVVGFIESKFFSCLLTTLKDAGSKEAQHKVDYDYQLNFAKAAKENNVEDFVLVSAYGASPNSKIFYSKMKGELEEEIKKLHFNKLTIFNPGMLERKNSIRTGEVSSISGINIFMSFNSISITSPLITDFLDLS